MSNQGWSPTPDPGQPPAYSPPTYSPPPGGSFQQTQPGAVSGRRPGFPMALVGLIVAIFSILLLWIPFLDLLLGAGGLVFGIVGRRQGARGLGLIALIIGIIGIVIGVLWSIIWIIGTIAANR